MFKNIKREIVVLMLMLGTLTSFVNAHTPTAPGAYVGVTDINCTAVRINFLDNSDDEDGFIVTGNFPNSPMYLPANDETNSAQVYADITGLDDCNKTYFIKIVAYEDDKNSSSANGSFNMLTTFGLTDCCDVVPEQPGPYIGATDINCTAVRINFLDNSDNEDGFIITGNFPNSPMYLPANDETNSSQVYADITDLDCNETYCISVMAYNNDGNSTPSDIRCFNIKTTFGLDDECCSGDVPAQPGPYIGVTDKNCTAVRINFVDNSNNEDGFIITGNFPGSPIHLPANDETNSSQVYADITGLDSNQTYCITVVASNNEGNSTSSDTRCFNIESTFGVTCP